MLVVLLASLVLAAGVVGETPPPIDAPDLGGEVVRLQDLRGKVVLVDFWATWCEPCRRSLPIYSALQRKYGDALVVVAVSVDEEREKVDEFLKANQLQLRVVHDPEGAIASRWEPPKMPTAWLIDREGVIRKVYEGFSESEGQAITRDLDALLPQPAPPTAPPAAPPG